MRIRSDDSPCRRINNTILSPLEIKIVRFLVKRTPDYISPNLLTLIGFLGALLIFLGYWFSSIDKNFLLLASFGWICNWYGDSLDGTIARYRKIDKPKYGFYVDHNVDAFSELWIGVGFGLSPYVRLDIALLLLIAYFLLNIQMYIYANATNIFRMSYNKMGATEFRVFAILFNFILYFFDFPLMKFFNLEITLIDLVVLILISGMLLTFCLTVLLNSIQMYKSEK